MTNEPADDQMVLDLEPDDYHEPVTAERVKRLLPILFLTGNFDKDYEACCKFLEPVLEYEYQIIREVLDANYQNSK